MVSSSVLVTLAAAGIASASPLFPFSLNLFQDQVAALPPPASALPAPASGNKLSHIALGLGTQNYTCKGAPTDAPKANGAVAVLYDATAAIFVASKLPTQLNAAQRITCDAERDDKALMPIIGHHWFNPDLVPTFDLSGAPEKDFPNGRFASVKLANRTDAPAGACAGRDGAPAVPWLLLADDARGVSRGVKEVYRVDTVGGSAPKTCEGKPAEFTQDYGALYYFYG